MSNRQKNLKVIGDILLGLKCYQDYTISYNGEIGDKTVDELVELLDDS